MATDHDSPKNGHDNDEDFPEVLRIIDQFDSSPPKKQSKLIARLRELATKYYVSSPIISTVCTQVADDLELRVSNSPPHSTDTDEQV